jgi:predicted acyltransferase
MNQRYYSLDVFRGATVALMILVNSPGSWTHIYTPLEHAYWDGLTPTDLVFPFFLFAVGNALAFVMPRLETAGDAVFWGKVIKRTLLIFGIGLFLNWFPFIKWDPSTSSGQAHLAFKQWAYMDTDGHPQGIRIFGVLQRIALAYFFGSIIIYYLKIRGAFIASAVILLGYWFLCVAMNPADTFGFYGWFGTSVDKAIIGEAHMYKLETIDGRNVVFDPEGLMSTFASIVQIIFGYFAGDYIIKKGKTHEMLTGLFVAGIVLMVAGFWWDTSMPINKRIWTSSYTVYTSGMAMVVLAMLIYMIEFKGLRGWLGRFFDVFGKNPLFIFMISVLIPRTQALIRIPNGLNAKGQAQYLTPFQWFFEHVCKPIGSDPRTGSLVYAIIMIIFYWAMVWWMDKKKVYVKV